MNNLTSRILKRYGFKSQRTELSAIDELKQSLEGAVPNTDDLNAIRYAMTSMDEFIDAFEEAKRLARKAEFDFETQIDKWEPGLEAEDDIARAMESYSLLARELGVDPDQNELYNSAKVALEMLAEARELVEQLESQERDYEIASQVIELS